MGWNQWLQRLGRVQYRSQPDYRKDRFKQRLSTVQQHLTECLDHAGPGPLRIISVCAGDGVDVIGVLRSHPRRGDVTAWLIELDQHAVAEGIRQARIAGLDESLHFLKKDATVFETYQPIAPADIVLLCGVWGHVPALERTKVVAVMRAVCKCGGAIIWTRGTPRGQSRLQEIQSLFADSFWNNERTSLTADRKWAVVTRRHRGPLQVLSQTGHFFHFRGFANSN